jgi:hypothetical protein
VDRLVDWVERYQIRLEILVAKDELKEQKERIKPKSCGMWFPGMLVGMSLVMGMLVFGMGMFVTKMWLLK